MKNLKKRINETKSGDEKMGWCSGTQVFDGVAEELLANPSIPNDVVVNVLLGVKEVLNDMDWDCEGDSAYWEHPFIGPDVLGNFEGHG